MIRIPKLIEEITCWMHVHFLKINPEKTELILFCLPSTKDPNKIQSVFLSYSCLKFSKSEIKIIIAMGYKKCQKRDLDSVEVKKIADYVRTHTQ